MSAPKRLPLPTNMVDSAPFGAGWSSLAARRAHNPKVVGSNPTPATNTIPYSGRQRWLRETPGRAPYSCWLRQGPDIYLPGAMRRALADGGSQSSKGALSSPSGGASRANRLTHTNTVSVDPECCREAAICMVVRRCSRAPGIQAHGSGTHNHSPGHGRAHETRLRASRTSGSAIRRHSIGQPPNRFPGSAQASCRPILQGSSPQRQTACAQEADRRSRIGCDSRRNNALGRGPATAAPAPDAMRPQPPSISTDARSDVYPRDWSRDCSPSHKVQSDGRFWGTAQGDSRPPAGPRSVSPPRRIAPTLLHCVKSRHVEDLYTQPELRQ